MKTSQEICDLAHAVAAIVQQQGQHDFPSYHREEDIRSASLCGITVMIRNGTLARIKAPDMEMTIEQNLAPAANDEKIVNMSEYKNYSFSHGSHIELERWHNRLTRFQTVFSYPPYHKNETGTG